MRDALAPKTRKLASLLDGPVNRSTEFTMVIVYCVGPERGGPVCGHNAMLKFTDLPDWNWQDISAHLKCTKCGAIGYVDTRLNWSEVIDFNRPDAAWSSDEDRQCVAAFVSTMIKPRTAPMLVEIRSIDGPPNLTPHAVVG